jgi:hypothetical protein
MSDFGGTDDQIDLAEQPDDELRVHSQDPAEGADPDDTAQDQPRVHGENAAEG